MGKEKSSRIFYEVFRKQKKEEPASGGQEQKPHHESEVSAEHINSNCATEATESRGGVTPPLQGTQAVLESQKPESLDTLPQRLGLRRDEVSVRQDAMVYAALGAVFLSLGCFFIGHKLGYNKGLKAGLVNVEPIKQTSIGGAKETLPQLATEKAERTLEAVPVTASQTTHGVPSQVVVSKEENWTLRIISYKLGDRNNKKAVDLARAIQGETGYDAFVAKTPKELAVCVGKFNSKDSSELLTLQKELRDFEYENKKQFKGCYPVRLK